MSKYLIKEKIGRGLFSKVYLAINKKKMKVALKIIKKSNFSSPKVLKKFIIEKEILRKSKNQNILKLYRTMQTKDKIYYELEYASRGNLLFLTKRNIVLELE